MNHENIWERLVPFSPTVKAGWEYELCRFNFDFVNELGSGSLGRVWIGRRKSNGRLYAIKEIQKINLTHELLIDQVRKQLQIMYPLNHPHIIKLFNHFQDQQAIYMVLEYAEKGQLFEALINSPRHYFSQQVASESIRQVVRALEFLQSKKIIHRDLKPQNILIGSDGTLKLGDFGWAIIETEHEFDKTLCGTLDYLAPQILTSELQPDHRVDIWCLGVLIYQLVTGSNPFSSQLLAENNYCENGVKENILALNYKFPLGMSPECIDIISRILMRGPNQRLTLNEITQHPWLQQQQKPLDETRSSQFKDSRVFPNQQCLRSLKTNLSKRGNILVSSGNYQQTQFKEHLPTVLPYRSMIKYDRTVQNK